MDITNQCTKEFSKQIDFLEKEYFKIKKKNSISTNLPNHLRHSFPNQEILPKRSSTMYKTFNPIKRDYIENESIEKIFKSLENLNIFKEKLSKMMFDYEKIFSSTFDNHLNSIKNHIVYIFINQVSIDG